VTVRLNSLCLTLHLISSDVISSTDFSNIILLNSGCQIDFNSMASKSAGSASKYIKVPLLLPSVGDDSDDDNDDDGDDDEEEEKGENEDDKKEGEKAINVARRKKEAEEEVVREVEKH
jgi:hypothetical protein